MALMRLKERNVGMEEGPAGCCGPLVGLNERYPELARELTNTLRTESIMETLLSQQNTLERLSGVWLATAALQRMSSIRFHVVSLDTFVVCLLVLWHSGLNAGPSTGEARVHSQSCTENY